MSDQDFWGIAGPFPIHRDPDASDDVLDLKGATLIPVDQLETDADGWHYMTFEWDRGEDQPAGRE